MRNGHICKQMVESWRDFGGVRSKRALVLLKAMTKASTDRDIASGLLISDILRWDVCARGLYQGVNCDF